MPAGSRLLSHVRSLAKEKHWLPGQIAEALAEQGRDVNEVSIRRILSRDTSPMLKTLELLDEFLTQAEEREPSDWHKGNRPRAPWDNA